jgi:hypothetical protein
MKNRMRQLRTCGSVRGEGREALTYSEKVGKLTKPDLSKDVVQGWYSDQRPFSFDKSNT